MLLVCVFASQVRTRPGCASIRFPCALFLFEGGHRRKARDSRATSVSMSVLFEVNRHSRTCGARSWSYGGRGQLSAQGARVAPAHEARGA